MFIVYVIDPIVETAKNSGFLSLIGIITGCIALLVSGLTLWFNFFRPPLVKCAFSYLSFKKLRPNVGTRILEQYLICRFSLRNLGTKSALIQGIRIRFLINNQEIFAYPTREVPLELIENIKSRDELLHANGAPFSEIVLAKEEVWKNNYAYSLRPCKIEEYDKLTGIGIFEIQVKYQRWCCWKARWKSVKIKGYKVLNSQWFGNIDGTYYISQEVVE